MYKKKKFIEDEVPEALWYLEEGHVQGKVAITMENNNKTYRVNDQTILIKKDCIRFE